MLGQHVGKAGSLSTCLGDVNEVKQRTNITQYSRTHQFARHFIGHTDVNIVFLQLIECVGGYNWMVVPQQL